MTTERTDQIAGHDPIDLFTRRHATYVRFIRTVFYPQGIRAYFAASSVLPKSGSQALDAGCGTGVVTLALREALSRRGLTPGQMHAFDVTPAMLERFGETLKERGIDGVELTQADVLELKTLPGSWKNYDLIVSASMLEYVPPNQLAMALGGLRALLAPGARFVLFMTRRNWLTRPLIGRWWQGHLYNAPELEAAMRHAGFVQVAFRRFPFPFGYLSLWGHIVEAS